MPVISKNRRRCRGRSRASRTTSTRSQHQGEVTREPKVFPLLGEDVLVYRTSDGPVAFKDLCIHRGTPSHSETSPPRGTSAARTTDGSTTRRARASGFLRCRKALRSRARRVRSHITRARRTASSGLPSAIRSRTSRVSRMANGTTPAGAGCSRLQCRRGADSRAGHRELLRLGPPALGCYENVLGRAIGQW